MEWGIIIAIIVVVGFVIAISITLVVLWAFGVFKKKASPVKPSSSATPSSTTSEVFIISTSPLTKVKYNDSTLTNLITALGGSSNYSLATLKQMQDSVDLSNPRHTLSFCNTVYISDSASTKTPKVSSAYPFNYPIQFSGGNCRGGVTYNQSDDGSSPSSEVYGYAIYGIKPVWNGDVQTKVEKVSEGTTNIIFKIENYNTDVWSVEADKVTYSTDKYEPFVVKHKTGVMPANVNSTTAADLEEYLNDMINGIDALFVPLTHSVCPYSTLVADTLNQTDDTKRAKWDVNAIFLSQNDSNAFVTSTSDMTSITTPPNLPSTLAFVLFGPKPKQPDSSANVTYTFNSKVFEILPFRKDGATIHWSKFDLSS